MEFEDYFLGVKEDKGGFRKVSGIIEEFKEWIYENPKDVEAAGELLISLGWMPGTILALAKLDIAALISLVICYTLGIVFLYMSFKASRQMRTRRQSSRSRRRVRRCIFCGEEIHELPKIKEKKIMINGVQVSVKKTPLCCDCYEEYKKWSNN